MTAADRITLKSERFRLRIIYHVNLTLIIRVKEFIAEVANDNDERLESVDDAARILGIESREDYIPGMNVMLRPHQIIGVAWSVAFYRSLSLIR